MVHFGRQKMTLALIVIRRRFLLFFATLWQLVHFAKTLKNVVRVIKFKVFAFSFLALDGAKKQTKKHTKKQE